MQKGFFRQREKLRFVRVSEYVYRKFSGSTSARTHREPHHVDFKPSLICASSRTNFPLSLYPASLSLFPSVSLFSLSLFLSACIYIYIYECTRRYAYISEVRVFFLSLRTVFSPISFFVFIFPFLPPSFPISFIFSCFPLLSTRSVQRTHARDYLVIYIAGCAGII